MNARHAPLGQIARALGATTDEVMRLLNAGGDRMTRKEIDKLRCLRQIRSAQPPEALPKAVRVRRFCKKPCAWCRGMDACVMPGGCWREIFKK